MVIDTSDLKWFRSRVLFLHFAAFLMLAVLPPHRSISSSFSETRSFRESGTYSLGIDMRPIWTAKEFRSQEQRSDGSQGAIRYISGLASLDLPTWLIWLATILAATWFAMTRIRHGEVTLIWTSRSRLSLIMLMAVAGFIAYAIGVHTYDSLLIFRSGAVLSLLSLVAAFHARLEAEISPTRDYPILSGFALLFSIVVVGWITVLQFMKIT